ncbi:hypothetical protein ABC733_06695 [Mangrovibacter sp. SLW1]
MSLNYKKLSELYGWDESTIRKGWVSRGLDITKPDDEVLAWVQTNIIQPLRETDLREQIDRERLRKMAAEAATAEIELEERLGNLIELSYLEQSLSEYFSQMKNYLRSIPQKYYLELFECQDALELKVLLQNIIDDVLNEIGNQEYEFTEELDEQEEITINLEEVDQDDITTKEDEAQ